MHWHWKTRLVLLLTLHLSAVHYCAAQHLETTEIQRRLQSGDATVVSLALESVNEQNSTADLVPALIEIIEADEYLSAELAIRALGRMKSTARSAALVLVRQLHHENYCVRSAAVDALVAIGEDAPRRFLTG